MEDSEIVGLFWARSEQALAETAAKYGAYCRRIALDILRSPEDAEECVNDAYGKAWDAIPPHRPERLSTFLGKITRNLALQRSLRGRAQKRGGGETALALSELEECVPARGEVGDALDAQTLATALDAFLRAQPARARRLFLARYWYLLPVAEIAARCGLSESSVKSSLFRTRSKLKIWLEREGFSC